MKGLSKDIEESIEIIFIGLNKEIVEATEILSFEDFNDYEGIKSEVFTKDKNGYTGIVKKVSGNTVELRCKAKSGWFFQTIHKDEIERAHVFDSDRFSVNDKKIEEAIRGKVDTFNRVREMLKKWAASKNAPTHAKLKDYIKRLVASGDEAIEVFRKALKQEIEYHKLTPDEFGKATKAKPAILDAIFDLEYSIAELRNQLESNEFDFSEREFRLGYPEKFAKQEFFPESDYYKNWYNEKEDAVRICPFSTEGRIIELQNFKIQLPVMPDKEEILFHDLPIEEQYWKRTPKPKITPDNIELYHDYIMEEYRRRREGIWFMNYGEPVYLTGNMYFALQWCKMSDGGIYMGFRYAQLNLFYFLEGVLIDDRCLGICFLKSRRTGFTYSSLAIMANMSTSVCDEMFGMTSMSDEEATKAFSKYSYMILNLPFWLRPIIKGREDSLEKIYFGKPSVNTKESKKKALHNRGDYLNTLIDHKPTKPTSYDGQRMKLVLSDEAGKWQGGRDYVRHLAIISFTLFPGGNVVGKIFCGSTVGKFNEGGEQFKKVYYNSNIQGRNKITKRTKTGLYSYFLPAQDNMEAFTDKYGVCWLEKPPMKTLNIKGKLIEKGTLDELLADEKEKKEADERAYNEQLRNMPRTEQHAFRNEASLCIYNITKLEDQMEYNEAIGRDNERKLFQRGNFEWVDGVKDGNVRFVPNRHGRFMVHWMPSAVDDTRELQNRVKQIDGIYYPMNEEIGVGGIDPFSHASTHGKGSRGAIHIVTRLLVPGKIPKKRFVLEYGARPSNEFIFYEDVIKVMRFYGIKFLIENNRPDLLRYLYQRGYHKFSMQRPDRYEHQLTDMERLYGGIPMSGEGTLDSHTNAIGAYIDDYVGESTNKDVRPKGEMGTMPFKETLVDWINFEPLGGRHKRSKCDLAISSGLALMGLHPDKYKPRLYKPPTLDLGVMFPSYNHSGVVGKKISPNVKPASFKNSVLYSELRKMELQEIEAE